MASRKPVLRVLSGSPAARPSALEAAYQNFRLERQGNLVSASTLQHYDWLLRPFLRWLAEEHPELNGFDALSVELVRQYRAQLATRICAHGRTYSPHSVFDSHRALMTFFRWAQAEGHQLDPRILALKRPRVPDQEPQVYHMDQLTQILAACNPQVPQEELAVRILVGSGLRASELCGLCMLAPDGLSDLMLDSMTRGRVELRVRWDAGAKGRKSRRVPITPKLAAAIKRYEARQRLDCAGQSLLVNQHGQPYDRFGIVSMMDRLQKRVGFRVHAHAFRHTFATVATKLGWNFEHLRAAMGHSDYKVLQRYVRLATQRDLGRRKDWEALIVGNPGLEWT